MVYASRDLFERADGARTFLRRRIARIVPLYWLLTTLFLLTLLLTPHMLSSAAPSIIDILKSYFFIPYVHDAAEMIQPVYKLGWTLEYEMFFYFAFALVLILPMHHAISAIALLFTGLTALGVWLAPAPGLVSFWTHPIILEFVMGACIAALYVNGRRLSAVQGGLFATVGILGFAAAAMSDFDAHGLWRPLLWGLPAALIVTASVLYEIRAAAQPAMRWLIGLGDASYAIYLLHPLIVRALRVIWDRAHANSVLSPWVFVILGLAIIIPTSLWVHRWIEQPMTKKAQRLLGSRKDSAALARSYRSA